MKKNQLVKLSVIALAVALSACSGGGGRRVAGKQCPLNYDPYPMDVPAEQKLDLSKPLESGSYEYNGASLFYKHPSKFRMELHDAKQRDGSFKGTIGCVRNATADRFGKSMSADGISQMVIEPGSSKVVSDVKTYGFLIQEDGHTDIDFIKSNRKLQSPSGIISENIKQSFLFKKSDTEYETRSYGVNSDGSEFYLVVRYIKKEVAPKSNFVRSFAEARKKSHQSTDAAASTAPKKK